MRGDPFARTEHWSLLDAIRRRTLPVSKVIAVGAALALAPAIGNRSFAEAASGDEPAPSTYSGYTKAYTYDSRLMTDKPPAFPASRVTNYLFFTNFEMADPGITHEPAGCAGKYYSEWIGRYTCGIVEFVSGDRVEGPFHSNDAVDVWGRAEFGRPGADPPDLVEIDGGTHPEDSNAECNGQPVFNTADHCYSEGERIPLPDSTTGLAGLAETEDTFSGETRLELDGNTNSIAVVNFNDRGEAGTKTIPWPRNGIIYISSASCGWTVAEATRPSTTDGPEEALGEKGCGNVYVRGTYARPLTIAAQEDVIVDGDIYPTSVAGQLGAAPTGTATLGLVAGDYVRVYHPTGTNCQNVPASEDPNGWGVQPDLWIYAAILAEKHAFFVDNFACGSGLGVLHIYGSLAQNYRGIVAIFGGVSGTTTGGGGVATPTVCASRRRFLVHVKRIRGVRYRTVNIALNGHRIRPHTTERGGITAEVDLRGLPRGSYVLRIAVETTKGRRITATRTYHTCAGTQIHPTRPSKL